MLDKYTHTLTNGVHNFINQYLILNFLLFPRVSNLLGPSSGRQWYTQYGFI